MGQGNKARWVREKNLLYVKNNIIDYQIISILDFVIVSDLKIVSYIMKKIP